MPFRLVRSFGALNDNFHILLVSSFEVTQIMTTSFQLQSHLKLFPISIPLVHKDAQCWVPSPVSSSAKQVHLQESSNQWICHGRWNSWVRAHFGQSNFLFFQQKRKKELLLILIIFTYFKVRTKKEKKKMLRKIDHFFNFLILKSASKIQKNTVNG